MCLNKIEWMLGQQEVKLKNVDGWCEGSFRYNTVYHARLFLSALRSALYYSKPFTLYLSTIYQVLPSTVSLQHQIHTLFRYFFIVHSLKIRPSLLIKIVRTLVLVRTLIHLPQLTPETTFTLPLDILDEVLNWGQRNQIKFNPDNSQSISSNRNLS